MCASAVGRGTRTSEGARRGAGGARRGGRKGQRRVGGGGSRSRSRRRRMRAHRPTLEKNLPKTNKQNNLLNTWFESGMNTLSYVHPREKKDIKRQKQHKQTQNKNGCCMHFDLKRRKQQKQNKNRNGSRMHFDVKCFRVRVLEFRVRVYDIRCDPMRLPPQPPFFFFF